jgi:hypothetical protein
MKYLTNLDYDYNHLLKDDTVRPELDYKFRVSNGRECLALFDEDKISSIICVAYTHQVPKNIKELDEYSFNDFNDPNSIAVFYTVWSYKKGAGRDIVFSAVEAIKQVKPWVRRFVTLSPKTEMAKKFHLGNGAFILSENEESINYEYEFRH